MSNPDDSQTEAETVVERTLSISGQEGGLSEVVDTTLSLPGSARHLGDEVESFLCAVDEVGPRRRLGDYRIERSIGRGGMGEVFSARNIRTGQSVALKWFGRGQAAGLHRFKREFRSVADVTHDNLVSLGELVVLDDGRAFFTMELLDGKPFHRYVRGRAPTGQLPNMVRLGRALRQLVTGVGHLHTFGFIHRDLKPSNVLVTTEGRVVILDFGLVSERESNKMSLNPTGVLVGTPSYIAPEHAARARADKPADLYAIGVMLYQCLCGALPFAGTSAVVLIRKQDEDAPDINERVADVPADLARLCMRLLERDPDARPTTEELVAAFTPRAERTQVVASSHASLSSIPSRERVRQMLCATILEVIEDGPVTVHLRHPPSADKSLVFDPFFEDLRAAQKGAGDEGLEPMLLHARCHERESVPYKGIDQIVDCLTLQLRNMGEVGAAALEPSAVSPLLRMFPVLNSVWLPDSLAYIGVDKGELRSVGVAALREVLTRAAERYQLIVCIEEFQWADVDGARILSELVRPPDAPLMLLIVTHTGEAVASEALDILLEPAHLRGRRILNLELGPMSDDEARELASEIVGDALDSLEPAERTQRIDGYVEHAKGDPFFLDQMIVADLAGETRPESLDGLVAQRVHALRKGQRRTLALLSACEGVCMPALLSVCGVVDVEAQIDDLLQLKLLRRVGVGEFEVAHDSIREVVLSEFERVELQALHRTLAEAMRDAEDGRFELIATQFELAGERELAIDYFERAGDRAGQAFAFGGAAELYRRALALLSEPSRHKRERPLERKLADQLVAAGKGVEAIDILLRLVANEGPAEARAIQRQVADLYIQSGWISEGLAQIEPVFRTFHERVPGSAFTSLLTLLWRRLVLRVRGMSFELRPADASTPKRLEHLDTLLSVWAGLTHQSPLLASMIHARYFRLALDAGEPLRLSRAFNFESVLELSRGRESSSDALMDTARQLLADSDAPVYEAVVEYTQNLRITLRHQWHQAVVAWPMMIDRLERVAGAQYLRALAASRYALTLTTLGDYRTLDELAPKWLLLTHDLGLRRDDAIIAAQAGLARLVLDPEDHEAGVGAMLDRARAWDAPGYGIPNFHIDLTDISRAIWLGEYDEALAICAWASEESKRWRLTMFELVRYNLADLCGRTCVLALSRDRSRSELVKRARAAAKDLRRGERLMYRGQAAVIEGALAAIAGEMESAQRQWAAALEAFEAAGMEGHVAAVRSRIAKAQGSAGNQRSPEAQAYFDAQKMRAHDRFVSSFAPAPES